MAIRELNPRENYIRSLDNVSTLDGRESRYTRELRPFLSEGALHRYRSLVEVEALIALSESKFSRRPLISANEKQVLRGLVTPEAFDPSIPAEYDHFGRKGLGPFEHDIKAVEVGLGERLNDKGLGRLNEWLHFPMTSEDVNNLAWNLMLRDAINNVWLPRTLEVCDKLADFSERYAHVPVLGKTHGMDASPTTFGKRFSYSLEQMSNVINHINELKYTGKLSGAVGNDNAIRAVAPDFDYEAFAREFVEGFGFEYEENANQRGSHLAIVRSLLEIKLMNVIGADLCENIRHNIMMKWLYQEGKDSHVGSSVMPHKINPWFFEVSEGYFEQSSQHIDGAANGLMRSVLERDLTDHPWERSYGEMLGKSLIGMSYISEGLDTLRVDDQAALRELQATPEVLSEAVQIAGRIAGVPNIYMTIKQLTRGRQLNRETLMQIIDENIPDESLRERLKSLKPEEYTGIAENIAKRTAVKYRQLRKNVEKGVLDEAKKVDAMLFDFDRTLQSGVEDELSARLTEITKRMGMEFTDEEIKIFGARSDYREMRNLMVTEHNRTHPDRQITENQFQETNNAVSGDFDDRLQLVDGVVETLEALRSAGKKTGLVTTRGTSLTRILNKHGITDLFDVIVGRDDTERRKPHPEPLAIALGKLGGIEPERVVFVGDHQEDDIIAGNAIGAKTVLISDKPLDPRGARPKYQFDNLSQLRHRFAR